MINQIGYKIKSFGAFISDKIKSFKYLALGEQISYSSIGLGLILIMVSVVLFIV